MSAHVCRRLFLLILVVGPASPNMDIRTQLISLFHNILDPDHIEAVYRTQTRPLPANHHHVINYVAKVTTQEFSEASSAIRKIRDTAAESYQTHDWGGGGDNTFWDAFTSPVSATNGSLLPVQYSARYQGNVSLTDSAVNLPIDVFSNWTDVRNTIQWSKGLNRAFTENYRRQPVNIFWQYLGTPQGILRSYPGTFIEQKMKYTFDVRRRPWYNAGIGCPKDVMMLIDTSGSLEGFPKLLLKTTAKKTIELILTDSDFVAAISVGTKATHLTCGGLLQRAENTVKRRLISIIEALPIEGTSNWEEGVEMTFRTFQRSRDSDLTSGCQQVIIIFSDETSQDLDEMITKFDPERKVRVYVFSFKRNEGLFPDKLEDLACLYHGVYEKILYFGQIGDALQNIVQAETTHLNGQEVEPTWSNVYRDLNGFGFVVTVTLPVVVSTSFSQRLQTQVVSEHSVSFLGVVGLDFKTELIIRRASSTLPLSTSLTLINNKGYPIYHDMFGEYQRTDVTTKLHEFQYSAENREALRVLEEKMMQREHVKMKIKTFFNVQSPKKGTNTLQDVMYETAPVGGTPFSLSVSYTEYPLVYRVLHNNTVINLGHIREVLRMWRAQYGLLNRFTNFSCKLLHKLLDETDERYREFLGLGNTHCNARTFSILTDLLLSKSFPEAFLNERPDADVLGRYIITYNGFLFYDNKEWNRTSSVDLKNVSPFLKVLKNLEGVQYYVSRPELGVFGVTRQETINITRRVEVEGRVVAAAGFEIGAEYLRKEIFKYMPPNMETFLLDENGYVIIRGPSRFSHQFIGKNHPYLLQELVALRVYTKHTHTECIAECEVCAEPEPGTATSASFSPSSLLHLLYRLLLLLLHLYLRLVGAGTSGHHNPFTIPTHHIRSVECCKEYTHYERNFSRTFRDQDSTIPSKCGCGAYFTVTPVTSTNLLMVQREVTPYCRCSEYSSSVSLTEGQRTMVHTYCYNSTHTHKFRPSKTCVLNRGEVRSPDCRSDTVRTNISFKVLLLMLWYVIFKFS